MMKKWVSFLCFQEDAPMNECSRSSRRDRRATTFSEMQFLMLRTRENKDLHCAVFCFDAKSRNVYVALAEVCEANAKDNEDQDVVYNNLLGELSSSTQQSRYGGDDREMCC
ncbi:unnamed protein product [Amoebophrya sp. A120]|nr:unnamed protein product [Amoebophrya sp. A120]|eukprot:GSA120T00016206001.1